MTIHESSCLKLGSGYGPPAPAAWPVAAASALAAVLKLTTSRPALLRKFLRDVVPFHFSNTSSTCFGIRVKVAALISFWFRPNGLTFAPLISFLFRPDGLTFAPLISFLFRPDGLTFAPL